MKPRLCLTVVVALLLHQYVCPSMVPGKGCGYKTPFNVRRSLEPDDDISGLGCTYVEDRASLKEYYAKKVPGKYSLDFF